jgi:HEAT repeat protein
LLEQYLSEYQEVDSAAASEQILNNAKIATDNPTLLEFLRKRTVDESKRNQAKPLLRDLGNAEFDTREKAERELLALGEAALPALEQAVSDPDPEVANRAKKLLKKIGKGKQTDPAVLRAVIRVVGYRKPVDASAALLAFLPSAPDEETRQEIQAALAAVAFHDGKPDKTLLEATSDKDAIRRAAALAALGRDADAGKERVGHRIFLPGLKMPVKGADYRDGNPERSWEITELKFYDRFPDSTFARPK